MFEAGQRPRRLCRERHAGGVREYVPCCGGGSSLWLYHSLCCCCCWCWLDFAAGVPCQALERERRDCGRMSMNNERYQSIVLIPRNNPFHCIYTPQYISLYIHATMNSLCTRCSLRLQRAAHTELRSTSTRAFSSAQVQRRGNWSQYIAKSYSILTTPSRHPNLP